MKARFFVLVAFLIVSAATTFARAATLFFDDFNSGASSAWSNYIGKLDRSGRRLSSPRPKQLSQRSLVRLHSAVADGLFCYCRCKCGEGRRSLVAGGRSSHIGRCALGA
jgi:hypothetical protein